MGLTQENAGLMTPDESGQPEIKRPDRFRKPSLYPAELRELGGILAQGGSFGKVTYDASRHACSRADAGESQPRARGVNGEMSYFLALEQEGPLFVWHFRGTPHIHVWVNIADDPSVL